MRPYSIYWQIMLSVFSWANYICLSNLSARDVVNLNFKKKTTENSQETKTETLPSRTCTIKSSGTWKAKHLNLKLFCSGVLKMYPSKQFDVCDLMRTALVSGARGNGDAILLKYSRVQAWTIIAHFPFVSDYQRNENTCTENTQSQSVALVPLVPFVPSAHTIKSEYLVISVSALCAIYLVAKYTLRNVSVHFCESF